MSQNPYAHPDPLGLDGGDEIPPRPVRTSILASLRLGCSLICCIPGLGLLGSLLGVGALVGISSSKGRVGGKGLAIAGVVVGLVITTVWIAIIATVAVAFRQLAPFGDAVGAAQAGDHAKVRLVLASGVQVSDEQIDRFGASLDAVHGAYVGMPTSLSGVFSSWMEQGMQFQGALTAAQSRYAGEPIIPLVIEFDSGPVVGVFVTDGGSGGPSLINMGVLAPDGSVNWLIDPPGP